MSRQINQPINQVRLTNVAVVRYNYKGKRFEIACYRNKVMDYRNGLETDLSEVLQTDRIFTNVSKGQFAKSTDLQKVFGTKDQEEIAKIILEKGSSLQVSNLEREQLYENTLSQIATWVAANCVNSDTGRPYTVTQIKHALKGFPAQPHKAIKKQYLDAVKFLKTTTSLAIERAKMELALHVPLTAQAQVQSALDQLQQEHPRMTIVRQETATRRELEGKDDDDHDNDNVVLMIVLQVDPSLYRDLNDLAKNGGGRLEILQQQVVDAGGGSGGTATVDVGGSTATDTTVAPQTRTFQHKDETSALPQEQPTTTTAESRSSDSDDNSLLEKLQAVRMQASSSVADDDDDDELVAPLPASQRQKKKKKQAKRREKQQQQQQAAKERIIESEGQRERPQVEVTTATVDMLQSSSPSSQANSSAVSEQQQQQESYNNKRSCNTCGGSFGTQAAYRAHFKSDWHRFNQKLLLDGVPPVSEQEFELVDGDTFFGTQDD